MSTIDPKIAQQIKNLQDSYTSELADKDEETLSFLDEINNLLRSIFKDDPVDVYTALTPDELQKWKQRKFKRAINRLITSIKWRQIFYVMMMLYVTGFLVTEAVSFYFIAGISIIKAYAKAILTEIAFIFISAYETAGKLQTVLVNLLRVALFTLMLFVISSDVIKRGTTEVSTIDKIQQKIELIEQQIEEKDKAIEFYRSKGWGVNMRKQLDEKDKLLGELLRLKQEQINGKSDEVGKQITYQTYGRAAFRVILVFINLLLARRLFKF